MNIAQRIINSGPIGSWESHYCNMSGTISWTEEDSTTAITIYGTPDWENERGETPIASLNMFGKYSDVDVITLKGTPNEQLSMYRKAILQTIKNVI